MSKKKDKLDALLDPRAFADFIVGKEVHIDPDLHEEGPHGIVRSVVIDAGVLVEISECRNHKRIGDLEFIPFAKLYFSMPTQED